MLSLMSLLLSLLLSSSLLVLVVVVLLSPPCCKPNLVCAISLYCVPIESQLLAGPICNTSGGGPFNFSRPQQPFASHCSYPALPALPATTQYPRLGS